MRPWIPACALLAASAALYAAAPAQDAYKTSVEAWRHDREDRLKADGGWLAVAGLFWLQPGSNTVGSAQGSVVALPPGSAPARVGTLSLDGKAVSLKLAPGVAATVGGKPASGTTALRPDTADSGPDVLKVGRLSMFVIERGGRYGVRLKDPESPGRRGFKGLQFFPVDPKWRVTAKFVSYDRPHSIEIANVLGQVDRMPSPGVATFTIDGHALRLEPVLEESDAKELFYIFRDETSGAQTYGAGRFLYSELPKGGTVVLDFNKAYSPPCAFTRYATCPLPPKQNRLPVRVEAGELKPETAH